MKASLKNILRLLSNYFAIIPSCPVIYIKPDFHMSGKSQTIRVFTVSRPSQILPTNENVDIPDLGWTRTNLENRERFYFPDAFQICVMVGNHFRQMKTQICFVGDVGDRFLSQFLSPSSFSRLVFKLFKPVLSGHLAISQAQYRFDWNGNRNSRARTICGSCQFHEPCVGMFRNFR